jgi:hypothetical protein
MGKKSFAAFLGEAVQALGLDFAAGHAAVCACLGSRRVALDVDGEETLLVGDGRRLRVLAASASRNVHAEVRLGHDVLRDLLQGRTTLIDAAFADRFDVRGEPHDVVAFHDTFTTFVSAAARCWSIPALLDDFLEGS